MGIISGVGKLFYYSSCMVLGAVLTYNVLTTEPTEDDNMLEGIVRDSTDIFSRVQAWTLEGTTNYMLDDYNPAGPICSNADEETVVGRCNSLINEYLECE